MFDRTLMPKLLLGVLLGCSLFSQEAAAVTGFEIGKVRVKAGNQWLNVPQSSLHEWTLKKYVSSWPSKVDVEVTWKSTYVTFTYAANPLDTEVFLDSLLQGHATMVDLNGAPAWAYTFTNRPSSGSFHVELHDVLGSNDVWSQNDKITLKPIPKIYFPAVLVNAPLNDASFPAGTQTVSLAISPLIPKKPPAVIRLEAQRLVGGQWTWTAPGTSNFAWSDFPYPLQIPQPGSYRVRFSGDSGAYTQWVNFTVL
jgi:hypothetical protein